MKRIIIVIGLLFVSTLLYSEENIKLNQPVYSDYKISLNFGEQTNPITSELYFHDGIDYSVPQNIEIYPVHEGIVLETGFNENDGYYIVISHDNQLKSKYTHLGSISCSKDQRVTINTVIAYSGISGMSTGPHLHLAIYKDNKPIDPSSLFGTK